MQLIVARTRREFVQFLHDNGVHGNNHDYFHVLSTGLFPPRLPKEDIVYAVGHWWEDRLQRLFVERAYANGNHVRYWHP